MSSIIPITAEALDTELARDGVPVVVSLRQVGKLLGKHPEALARLAQAGVLPARRTPSIKGQGPYWIARSDLARYLVGMSQE